MSDIKEKMIEQDGKLHVIREQEVSDILKYNKRQQDDLPSMYGDAKFRKVGSIPFIVAEQWMKECGAPIASKEFNENAKKKLKDSNYAYLRVKKW
jgi:hypothetical protein